VACHVTLRLGVIHAMEGRYHASVARSLATSPSGALYDCNGKNLKAARDYSFCKISFERKQAFNVPLPPFWT
jgi:hypothetical protein